MNSEECADDNLILGGSYSNITMIYCGSGHFRVFKFLRICDFVTLHEVQNLRIANLDEIREK